MRVILAVLLLLTGRPGLAPAATGTTEGVIRFLEERLQRDPDDFVASGKLGHTYLQLARESGAAEGYARAERAFRLVLQWTPESYPARVALASALVSQHQFREAAALAGQAAVEAPNEPSAHAVLGDALLEIGDLAGAGPAYRKLFALEPGLPAWSRLAKLDWLQGRTDAALTNWARAVQCSNAPPEALAWARVQQGELFFRLGRSADAETNYAAALEIFPDYFLALDHLAEWHAAQGKFDAAAKMFEQLAGRTRRPEYLQAAGDALVAERKTAEAKLFHDRALAAFLKETGVGQVHYFHHLAGFYADVRADGAESEKWARRNLEVRQNIYAWDALAWALFWKKDYSAAVDAMQKALAAGTKDAQLFAHAGAIFVRAGKIKEGQAFMKRATEVNPHYGEFHVHR